MRCPPFLAPALLISALSLALPTLAPAYSKFDLTDAQKARIQKYLPHTFPKLQQHAPVNVMLVGDSITGMYVHDENDSNTLKSYGGLFIQAMADQFYYTGGIRIDRPYKGTPEKGLPIHGPEIIVQNSSRGGRLMIHAMNILDTSAWGGAPDLVIVNFGVNDAIGSFSYSEYRKAAQEVVDTVHAHGADLIILGSTVVMNDPAEFGMGITRPYADIAREVAEKNGIFYADLGDISWMVRVDEPMRGLEKPDAKKPEEVSAKTASPEETAIKEGTNGVTPNAIIQFPYAEELDPDPEKRAARMFKAIASDLRARFDHGSQVDLVHPNSGLHKLLGRRVWAELLNGPRKVLWSLGSGRAEFKDANTFTLTYRAENLTDLPLRLSLLPLITTHWKPQEAETQIELKPQRKGPLTVTYTRRPDAPGEYLPSAEDNLRLPIVVLGNGNARIEVVHSLIEPCSVRWDLGAQFNVDEVFTVNPTIVATGGDDLEGTWHANWLGQKFEGKLKVPAHQTTTVPLHFKLPGDSSKMPRERGILNFSITTKEGLTLPFNREIEAVQNLGLKEPVPMVPIDKYLLNDPQPANMPDQSHPGITFHADADPKALYLMWDFVGLNLVEDSKGHAVTIEMNIDARSYGKRLKFGVTDAMRFFCGAADGDGDFAPIQAWSYGNGYGLQRIDMTQLQSHLTSRQDGSRRFTVMIPRNFFFLHEWALGNGNSELGFNMTLLLEQKADEKNPKGSFTPYLHSTAYTHRDEVESLVTLELSEHPTKRWTVHFF